MNPDDLVPDDRNDPHALQDPRPDAVLAVLSLAGVDDVVAEQEAPEEPPLELVEVDRFSTWRVPEARRCVQNLPAGNG